MLRRCCQGGVNRLAEMYFDVFHAQMSAILKKRLIETVPPARAKPDGHRHSTTSFLNPNRTFMGFEADSGHSPSRAKPWSAVMSVDHFKKQAKNAKHHLPEIFAQHPPPYSLTECQEFIAKINGYPSWHIAAKEAGRKSASPSDDPIAAFYSYDWRKASLSSCCEFGESTACRIEEKQLSASEAWTYLMEDAPSLQKSGIPIVLINQAGDRGSKLLDKIYDENSEFLERFPICSLTNLSSRGGATINPLEWFTVGEIVGLFRAILTPVATTKQTEACQKALDLLLSGIPSNTIDLLTVQQSVSRLMRLAHGGWGKSNEDFYQTFPDDSRHEEANDFLDQHESRLPGLIRPLHAFLTRLAAPELDMTFNPRRCAEMKESRDEAFRIYGEKEGDLTFDIGAGLEVVNLSFGSEVLDHIAGLLVAAKIRGASNFYMPRSFIEEPSIIELIVVKE